METSLAYVDDVIVCLLDRLRAWEVLFSCWGTSDGVLVGDMGKESHISMEPRVVSTNFSITNAYTYTSTARRTRELRRYTQMYASAVESFAIHTPAT